MKRPFLGHAVKDGRIRFSSIKQIKMFDPSEDGGCPRKWVFEYLLGKRPAKAAVLYEGIDGAQQMEHYLTTGENVLPTTLLPLLPYLPTPQNAQGAFDLEVEQPLGDIATALQHRDALLNAPERAAELVPCIRAAAGLMADDVPLEGAADCRHARQEYITEDKQLVREAPGTYVVEICDLKMVSRIFDDKIRSGPNAGTVLRAYTKTNSEVCHDTQLLGYLRHAIDKYPQMTHGRASLWYANKKKREAVKRTGLISVEQIVERWSRIDGVMREMKQVASSVDKIEDVPPNVNACDSFTHVDPNDPTGKTQLKGCAHRYYCPKSDLQVSQLISSAISNSKSTFTEEKAMSLFDTVSPEFSTAPSAPIPAPPVPTVQPMTDAAYAAAVEEEKRRLLEGPKLGTCSLCSDKLTPMNTSRLQNGVIIHIGCKMGNPVSVRPLDQPAPQPLVESARPVPPQAVAEIARPELRARVEEHTKQVAAVAVAAAVATTGDASPWCANGRNGEKLVISPDVAMNGYTCECGKHWSMKALKPVKEGNDFWAVIPKHKPVSRKEPAPPVPVAAPAPVLDASPAAAAVLEWTAPPAPPVALTPETLIALAGGNSAELGNASQEDRARAIGEAVIHLFSLLVGEIKR